MNALIPSDNHEIPPPSEADIQEYVLKEMQTFEKMVAQQMFALRARLQNYPKVTELHVEIKCSGPVHHGELAVTFQVASSSYGGTVAKSHTFTAAVEEFIRRAEFDKVNNSLMIAQSGDTMRT